MSTEHDNSEEVLDTGTGTDSTETVAEGQNMSEHDMTEDSAAEERTTDGNAPADGEHSFIDDDEVFLNADDKILEYSLEEVVAQQPENVVVWSFEGLFNEDGKVLNKFLLRESPPMLTVRSSDGDVAEFAITKDLSRALAQNFSTINKAFYGVKPPEEMTLGERARSFKDWVKANKFKAFISAAAIVAVLAAIFIPR